MLDQFAASLDAARAAQALVLGHVPGVAGLLPPHGLRQRLHLPRDGLVRLRGAGTGGAGLAAPEVPAVLAGHRSRLGADHRALAGGRSRQRLRRARHRHRRLLQPVPARAVQRHARGTTRPRCWSATGSGTSSAPQPCRWIFEQQPERYARHKDVVKRVLAGEAPANLVELVRSYFGLDYHTWGKDAYRGEYPFIRRPAGGHQESSAHDPALRVPAGGHDGPAGAGAARGHGRRPVRQAAVGGLGARRPVSRGHGHLQGRRSWSPRPRCRTRRWRRWSDSMWCRWCRRCRR